MRILVNRSLIGSRETAVSATRDPVDYSMLLLNRFAGKVGPLVPRGERKTAGPGSSVSLRPAAIGVER